MCVLLDGVKGMSANELLKKYHLENSVPVDLDKLTENLGINIYEVDFTKMTDYVGKIDEKKEDKVQFLSDVLGILLPMENQIAIVLKPNLSYHRKRFTIAHEIGHCCLNDELKSSHIEFRHSVFSSDIHNQKEIAANIFAGELLMPEEAVKKVCAKFIVPEINAIAKVFQVSVSVASKRLNYLNIPYIHMGDLNYYARHYG